MSETFLYTNAATICTVLVLCAPVCLGTVIDLTHVYGTDVLYPPVGPNGTADLFNFTIMHRGYNADLDAWLEINWYGVFEHGSTHIDAPAHYSQGRAHLHELNVEQFIGPGVMINVQDKTKTDRDYVVIIADIKRAWEGEHGEIPRESIVMLNTGKHRLYPNRKLFYDTDSPLNSSTYHNAGLHPDAARWLMHNRQIKAFGTDAHSCDIGQNNNRNRCHEQFLPNDVLLLEFVANLDRMPPTGSRVIFAPMKLRDGSGGPTRILCLFGDGGEAMSASTALQASTILLTVISFVLLYI